MDHCAIDDWVIDNLAIWKQVPKKSSDLFQWSLTQCINDLIPSLTQFPLGKHHPRGCMTFIRKPRCLAHAGWRLFCLGELSQKAQDFAGYISRGLYVNSKALREIREKTKGILVEIQGDA